jgi:hypothetical protein
VKENPIIRMFEWWNAEFRNPQGFAPEAFRLHYREDARLIVNGNLRGEGVDALSRHYRRLQSEFDSIQMELPVIDEFACDDRAFVQCITRAERSGELVREESMAVATLTTEGMSLLKVIGHRLS